jgi:hypothetical protein
MIPTYGHENTSLTIIKKRKVGYKFTDFETVLELVIRRGMEPILMTFYGQIQYVVCDFQRGSPYSDSTFDMEKFIVHSPRNIS